MAQATKGRGEVLHKEKRAPRLYVMRAALERPPPPAYLDVRHGHGQHVVQGRAAIPNAVWCVVELHAQLPARSLECLSKDSSGEGEQPILLPATRRQELEEAKDDGAARKHRLIVPRLGMGQVDTAR